jgi:hypothetical protein
MPSLLRLRSLSPVTSRLRYFLSIRFAAFPSIAATVAASVRVIFAQSMLAHIVLEPLGVGAVRVREVQLLNATIATSAPYLPLSEDEVALLRAEIEVSDPSGIGILNGRALLATDGAIGSPACTIQY